MATFILTIVRNCEDGLPLLEDIFEYCEYLIEHKIAKWVLVLSFLYENDKWTWPIVEQYVINQDTKTIGYVSLNKIFLQKVILKWKIYMYKMLISLSS